MKFLRPMIRLFKNNYGPMLRCCSVFQSVSCQHRPQLFSEKNRSVFNKFIFFLIVTTLPLQVFPATTGVWKQVSSCLSHLIKQKRESKFLETIQPNPEPQKNSLPIPLRKDGQLTAWENNFSYTFKNREKFADHLNEKEEKLDGHLIGEGWVAVDSPRFLGTDGLRRENSPLQHAMELVGHYVILYMSSGEIDGLAIVTGRVEDIVIESKGASVSLLINSDGENLIKVKLISVYRLWFKYNPQTTALTYFDQREDFFNKEHIITPSEDSEVLLSQASIIENSSYKSFHQIWRDSLPSLNWNPVDQNLWLQTNELEKLKNQMFFGVELKTKTVSSTKVEVTVIPWMGRVVKVLHDANGYPAILLEIEGGIQKYLNFWQLKNMDSLMTAESDHVLGLPARVGTN